MLKKRILKFKGSVLQQSPYVNRWLFVNQMVICYNVKKLFGNIMATDDTESQPVSDIWTQRSLGIELPQNIEAVSASDVEYICNNSFPFLQVINSDAVFSEETSINFVTASTGWVIHDYGDAISVAAPHNITNPTEKKEEKQETTTDDKK